MSGGPPACGTPSFAWRVPRRCAPAERWALTCATFVNSCAFCGATCTPGRDARRRIRWLQRRSGSRRRTADRGPAAALVEACRKLLFAVGTDAPLGGRQGCQRSALPISATSTLAPLVGLGAFVVPEPAHPRP